MTRIAAIGLTIWLVGNAAYHGGLAAIGLLIMTVVFWFGIWTGYIEGKNAQIRSRD